MTNFNDKLKVTLETIENSVKVRDLAIEHCRAGVRNNVASIKSPKITCIGNGEDYYNDNTERFIDVLTISLNNTISSVRDITGIDIPDVSFCIKNKDDITEYFKNKNTMEVDEIIEAGVFNMTHRMLGCTEDILSQYSAMPSVYGYNVFWNSTYDKIREENANIDVITGRLNMDMLLNPTNSDIGNQMYDDIMSVTLVNDTADCDKYNLLGLQAAIVTYLIESEMRPVYIDINGLDVYAKNFDSARFNETVTIITDEFEAALDDGLNKGSEFIKRLERYDVFKNVKFNDTETYASFELV